MKLELIVFARRAALVLPACLALNGCMTSTPIWDAHFGQALKAVKQAQIIDPHAGEHAPATQSIDGVAATAAMDNYDRNFRKPPQTANPYVIGIGSGSSGQ
ncbi:conserved exported hypothetical protein [Paraburkholderia piptadeniae]|uniref:Lipoprotein n=1 Tax=Paraburkholderia piptadeniae TaxID=1701573 RepID=A0A1N7STA2_9BURK|nr:hypothetical protein [Paraburkholderia piptadeniae]SIT50177.1 conserved exported hypothetical protein [Paraburkholderia piptadeniae]